MNDKSRKVVFVSFADSRYAAAIERLDKETVNFHFDERYFFSEKKLPNNFFDGFNPKIYRRGYGYWIWKPYVVKKVFDTIKEDDILVYSDCGNRWVDKKMNRFSEYLSMLNGKMNILTFQQPFLEKDWTKGDVFQHICKNDWKKYAVSLQLWSGCFFLKKCEETKQLINKWFYISNRKRDLFTDKKSKYPNVGYFQENRHDQSCFSLLVKQLPHIEISWSEVDDIDGTWSQFGDYPIQAQRAHKPKKGLIWFIQRVLLRPYLWIIGEYLIFFKNFYFRNKKTWIMSGMLMHLIQNIGGVVNRHNRVNPYSLYVKAA